MGIKLFRHKGNPHGYQTIYAQRKTPWVSKYLGTKETHMSIKLGRHRGNPHGYKTRQHRGTPHGYQTRQGIGET